MPISTHSPQLIAILKAYATSLEPTPEPEYEVIHSSTPYVEVPKGCLPLRIAQFDDPSLHDDNAYHWAIFIPTSTQSGVGNYYDIVGSPDCGYFLRYIVDARHPLWTAERGSHLVGYVEPSYLKILETHFSCVPVQQEGVEWICQTWIVDALKELESAQVYAVQMDYGQWVKQMEIVKEAWDVGDA